MRITYIANALSIILGYLNIVIISPVVVALIYHDYKSIIPFVVASFIAGVLSLILKYGIKGVKEIENLNDIKKAEALFIVATSWMMFGLISAIPYLFYGLSPLNALFEAVSGITTTGATIITDFNYPHAFFFWRSLTQWLGGLGIIVLFIAILPQFAVAGRQMFFAEVPGPTEDKFTPRIRNTASSLWKVYTFLTLVLIALLIVAGMPVFDAICNALSTLAAGGFSPHPQSIMGYNSNVIIWIILIFMFFAGASFNLQYQAIAKHNPLIFFKSEEFKLYLFAVLVMGGLIATSLVLNSHYSIFAGITHALYQVISISTSTGGASVNYVRWDLMSRVLLFMVMFMGSCSSSAGGGIKMTRWILVFKSLKAELVRILHPNAVLNIKIDNNTIPAEVIRQVVIYVFYYFMIFGIFAVLLTLLERNTTIGICSAITAIGNIGPGFGDVIGPLGSFASLHALSKIIMIIGMLVGRLELIPFFVMLEPDFWNFKER